MSNYQPDPYDQHTDFYKLPKLLKRIPFEEKVRQCFALSKESLRFINHPEIIKQGKNVPLPWAVETLALLCIESKENPGCSASKRVHSQFVKMYNAVNSITPYNMPDSGNEIIKFLGPVYARTQFDIQETPIIKYCRYSYIFNYQSEKLDVKELFFKKFGAFYDDFLSLCGFLELYYQVNDRYYNEVLKYLLLNRYKAASAALSITRDDYITELHRMTDGSNDKTRDLNCVRPSYRYAFVQDGNALYVPLPHLLHINITTSMFCRLTENNNALREQIGKYALEDYLLTIIKGSTVYDSVSGEQKYSISKKQKDVRSSDVIAKKEGDLLFLDSKASVPSKSIRDYDSEAYKRTINQYADNIVQLYKQIQATPKYFIPFSGCEHISRDNIWGVVVVHEDARFIDDEIYPVVCSKLSIDNSSGEEAWVRRHIKITSLYNIELLCFSRNNIIDAIKESFILCSEYPLTAPTIKTFEKKHETMISELACDIVERRNKKEVRPWPTAN